MLAVRLITPDEQPGTYSTMVLEAADCVTENKRFSITASETIVSFAADLT